MTTVTSSELIPEMWPGDTRVAKLFPVYNSVSGRSEGRTFLSTKQRRDSVPTPEDQKSQLGNWIHPDKLQDEVQTLFPRCMTGRTMYVIPFSMGPIGSPLSKIGVEITDSAYVAISMGIMTRLGTRVFQVLGDGEFVKVES